MRGSSRRRRNPFHYVRQGDVVDVLIEAVVLKVRALHVAAGEE